jgi:hypothetical protein
VSQAQDIINKDKKTRKAKEIAAETKKRERWQNSNANPAFMENARKWAWEQCWCCHKEGRQLSEFYERMIIGLEKSRIKGTISSLLLAPTEFAKELGFPVPTYFLRRMNLPEDPQQRERILHDIKGGMDKRSVVEMMQIIQVCEDCAKKHDLDFWPNPPQVDLKTLAILGNIPLPKEITEIAKREIVTEIAKREIVAEASDNEL